MATVFGGLHSVADYHAALQQFLINAECIGGVIDVLPYFDPKSIVTIGIGFNIDEGDADSEYLRYVLQEINPNLDQRVSEIDPTKTANDVIAATINSVTPRVKSNNLKLQNELNDTLRTHFKILLGANATFSITTTQAKNILDKILASKESRLEAWLTEYNIDVAALKGSSEYMALTSLFYAREIVAKKDKSGNDIIVNGRKIPDSKSLIGPKLLAALEYDNRVHKNRGHAKIGVRPQHETRW